MVGARLVYHPGAGVQDVPHNLAVQDGHQIQPGDEVRRGPDVVQQVVLVTAGDVVVPKGLPGQLLHSAAVLRRLGTDGQVQTNASFEPPAVR